MSPISSLFLLLRSIEGHRAPAFQDRRPSGSFWLTTTVIRRLIN